MEVNKRYRENDELAERKYKSSGGYYEREILNINFYGNSLFLACKEFLRTGLIHFSQRKTKYEFFISDVKVLSRFKSNNQGYTIYFNYPDYDIEANFHNDNLVNIVMKSYKYLAHINLLRDISVNDEDDSDLVEIVNNILTKNFVKNEIMEFNWSPEFMKLRTTYFTIVSDGIDYYSYPSIFNETMIVWDDLTPDELKAEFFQDKKISSYEGNEKILSAFSIAKEYIEDKDEELKVYFGLLNISQ